VRAQEDRKNGSFLLRMEQNAAMEAAVLYLWIAG
jgi:hypothetical protein